MVNVKVNMPYIYLIPKCSMYALFIHMMDGQWPHEQREIWLGKCSGLAVRVFSGTMMPKIGHEICRSHLGGSKWLGSPLFTSHGMAIYKGNNPS